MAAKILAFPSARKRRFRSPGLWELSRDGLEHPANCVSLGEVVAERCAASDAELITVQVTRRFWNALQAAAKYERKDEQS